MTRLNLHILVLTLSVLSGVVASRQPVTEAKPPPADAVVVEGWEWSVPAGEPLIVCTTEMHSYLNPDENVAVLLILANKPSGWAPVGEATAVAAGGPLGGALPGACYALDPEPITEAATDD